ncbi:MAG: anthranilate phosphoribosyltransferase [Deltaproteobacteria bacterium]|nr:MAG: anthranilate phosphoribosyltransferase [Deltaproteobacteria bacterium]
MGSAATWLGRIVGGERLDTDASAELFTAVMRGEIETVPLAGILAAMATRRETTEEILGAARAMRAHVARVRPRRAPLLDTCGTGGSGVSRRNVSTAVALVAAARGVAVAKHGNRAASSRCGSADVLEALGVDVEAPPSVVARCIDEVGVGFLFARSLHPAMAHAAPVRRALGVRTIFNLLGPLTNPAFADRYAMGVFDPTRAEDMARVLAALGAQRALVVHGFEGDVAEDPDAPWGIDDVSLAGQTLVVEARGGSVERWIVTPEDLGLSRRPWRELAGGDPEDNARALTDLLEGRGQPAYRDAVLAAGALALLAASDAPRDQLGRFVAEVDEVLRSGAAAEVLARLVEASRTRRPGEDG